MQQHGPWKTIKSETKHESAWIKIDAHDVINPAGKPGHYSTVHFKNIAIGIIPLDNEYNTWIVGQYRYPLKEYHWEIPEGGGKLDVEPIESAKRELSEEVGLKANNWQEILTMHLSNSASDEKAIIYLATNLTLGESHPDEDEELTIKKLPFKEVYNMVLDGEITDAMSVAAILKTHILIKEGSI